LVLDEVQTGFHRTGKFLAAHHYAVDPDIIVLAKAMSGGLVLSGAVLMTDRIYDSVYGSLRKSLIHTSTYSENGLAMRVGLGVLDMLEREDCEVRSAVMGSYVRRRLREMLADFEMVQEVRGEGLFSGIVFRAPKKMSLRVPFEAVHKDTSSDIRPSARHASIPRPRNPRSDLRQQFHGVKGCTAINLHARADRHVRQSGRTCG